MLLIHHVNLSHFKSHESSFRKDVQVFLILECVLYGFDILNMFFHFIILVRASQFHFNFLFVQGFLFIIHFFDNIVVLILKLLILTESIDDTMPTSSWLYWILMNISIACYFSALSTLFFLTLERLFATIHIHDYEAKPRRCISSLLSSTLLLFGVVSCFVVQRKEYTVYLITILMFLNCIALMLHCLLQWWNKRIYVRLRDSVTVTAYSLTQRFQVAENIKSLNMMNNIIIYMGIMNVIVVLSGLFSSFDITPELQLILTFFLDTSIFIYSFCYPVIMYKSSEKWRAELSMFIQMIRCQKPSSSVKVAPIRNSFGKDMEPANTINHHFEQLRSSWDKAIARKSIVIDEI